MSIYDEAQAVAAELIDEFANPNKVTVKRRQRVPDGQGGFDTSLVSIYSNLNCVVIGKPRAGAEINAAGRLNYEPETVFYIKHSDAAGLLSSDIIEFGGEQYEIKDPDDISRANAAWMIIARKAST